MKVFNTTKRGIEIWVLTTNAGTLLGTFASEAGARTRYLSLGGQPTPVKK